MSTQNDGSNDSLRELLKFLGSMSSTDAPEVAPEAAPKHSREEQRELQRKAMADPEIFRQHYLETIREAVQPSHTLDILLRGAMRKSFPQGHEADFYFAMFCGMLTAITLMQNHDMAAVFSFAGLLAEKYLEMTKSAEAGSTNGAAENKAA